MRRQFYMRNLNSLDDFYEFDEEGQEDLSLSELPIGDWSRINFDDLVFAFKDEAYNNSYYLDKRMGYVLLVSANLLDCKELTNEIEINNWRYIYIPKVDPNDLKKDIDAFASQVEDPKLKEFMSFAILSPTPANAMRKVLENDPTLEHNWHQFRKNQIRNRIEKWLKANFI